MDGFKIPYKQTQSFGLSTNDLSGDFVYSNSYPNWNANGEFNTKGALNLYTQDSQNIDTTQLFTAPSAVASKYSYGAILAPNGYIFYAPSLAGHVGYINSRAPFNTGTIGSGLTDYASGVLYKDYIYFAPRTSPNIIQVNWKNFTLRLIPHRIPSPNYLSAILAPNGWIYFLPFNSTQLWKFHPDSKTIEIVANISGPNKWSGAVLYNNFIYGVPFTDTRIIKLDTRDDSFTFFGNISGTNKWFTGVLAQNGKIYCCPENQAGILKIDPDTDTFTIFGTLPGSSDKYRSAVIATNGFIYFIPATSLPIVKLNPLNDTFSTFGSFTGGGSKWYSAVLGENGDIFAIPQAQANILKIKTTNRYEEDSGFTLKNFVLNRNINRNS